MSNHLCIPHLFETQVAQTPNATALCYQNEQLTYEQLNQQANQLAHHLQTLGVKPDSLVGVCLDRTPTMVIALLAILKAGGAYVPLDPTYPQERLAFIVQDTQLQIVLTQEHWPTGETQFQPPDFTAYAIHAIHLDTDWPKIATEAIENPPNTAHPEHLAYIIYTSGSTGTPKGVAIEHRNTVALIQWARDFFTPDQLQGVLASTSLCFDLSVFEIFVTLSAGGTIILAQNALELPHLPAKERVTLINTVPSAIAALLNIQGIPPSACTINLAGEPLQNALVQKLYHLDFVKQVFNLYGPSEDTTYSTVALIPKGFSAIPPIGHAIANTQVYLLDERLNPVPQGTVGEIYISGAGLARGYLNRPQLTAEKFLPSPFKNDAEARIYKTGDLAVTLPDGNLKCLGRIDHQVKIRGFRVELGEIEAVLNQHPQVSQSIVLTRKDTPDHERLVAYLVPEFEPHTPFSKLTSWTIRNALKQRLPDYMIPSTFVILEEFPLTLNGKIDRRALPVPQWTRTSEGTYTPPQNALQTKLVQLWSDRLGINAQHISIYDDFYHLGGHSLLALQMLTQVGETFGLDVPLTLFLKNPTLDGLATTLETLRQGNSTLLDVPDLESAIHLDSSIYPENHVQGSIPSAFLTGASGFLGAGLLSELLQQTRADIYCLVRATSKAEARAKIKRKLQKYFTWEETFDDRIFIVLGDLSQPLLGIEPQTFSRLTEKIDLIYHCGAWVNLVYPYSTLEEVNVQGTQEVIRLASQTKSKPLHFVSTIDVFGVEPETLFRTVHDDDAIGPGEHLLTGYAQSKYVAENLVKLAQDRGLPASIYRPSNIIGHSETGKSQTSDFVATMLQGCLQMGLAPDLPVRMNLVPVNYVSRAMIALSYPSKVVGKAFNLVNSTSMSWSTLITRLQKRGYEIQLTPYEHWYQHLLQRSLDSASVEGEHNALLSLVSMLKNFTLVQNLLGAFSWETQQTERVLITNGLKEFPDSDRLLETYLDYLTAIDFLPTPRPQKPSKLKDYA